MALERLRAHAGPKFRASDLGLGMRLLAVGIHDKNSEARNMASEKQGLTRAPYEYLSLLPDLLALTRVWANDVAVFGRIPAD